MNAAIRVALALLLWMAGVSAAQDDLQAERLLLTFIPNVQFAPFYVGIQDRHFAEQGFDLRVEHLQEPEVVDLVAAGQANFGIVSGEQVILARSQGRDVIYVFEWFQQYPVGIVIANEGELAGLESLRGKRVGLPGRFGASYTGLTALLHSAGLSEDDIAIDEIGFNAPEVFCIGAVDAAVVYINNEPLQIQERLDSGDCGEVAAINVVAVASQVDLVSNGLITSADLLGRDPGRVGRMARSLSRALQATINNPAHAYLVSLDYVDNLPGAADLRGALAALAAEQRAFLAADPARADIVESRAGMLQRLRQSAPAADLTQFAVLLRSIELWDAERLGYSDLASWQAMVDTLRRMGVLGEREPDLAKAYSNDFLAGEGE